MPLEGRIFGLGSLEIEKVEVPGPVVVQVRDPGPVRCPRCQSEKLRNKGRLDRRVRHENVGKRRCFLKLEARKYHCLGCGRYFNQRFGLIGRWRRTTHPYRRQVVHQHQDGISQKTLSLREGIGSATVERWYHEFLDYKVRERQNDPCPRVLGIDEHFFTRKQGYATTLCDLGSRKIHDVVLGRSEQSLQGYFARLTDKLKVRVVCMDLSSSYRSLVRKHFPKAKIVTDRFHVIRLVNQQFLATWKLLDPQGRANLGLLSLMRRHQERLRPDQQVRLRQYLKERPALEAVYDFKQKLCRLLVIKHRTVRQCRRLIPIFLHYLGQLREAGFAPMVQLGRTLTSWSEEIVRMWRFTKNNGITEGFHNKMEMISRRAFGFRNFENYRLRVRVLCS